MEYLTSVHDKLEKKFDKVKHVMVHVNPVSEKEFKDAEERYNLETKEITDQRNKLISLESTIILLIGEIIYDIL